MLECFDVEKIKKVYGYNFDLKKIEKAEEVSAFDGTNIFMIQQANLYIPSTYYKLYLEQFGVICYTKEFLS